jgi:hypothetical protein
MGSYSGQVCERSGIKPSPVMANHMQLWYLRANHVEPEVVFVLRDGG